MQAMAVAEWGHLRAGGSGALQQMGACTPLGHGTGRPWRAQGAPCERGSEAAGTVSAACSFRLEDMLLVLKQCGQATLREGPQQCQVR